MPGPHRRLRQTHICRCFFKTGASGIHILALAKYDQAQHFLNNRDHRRALLATAKPEKKLLARMHPLAQPHR